MDAKRLSAQQFFDVWQEAVEKTWWVRSGLASVERASTVLMARVEARHGAPVGLQGVNYFRRLFEDCRSGGAK